MNQISTIDYLEEIIANIGSEIAVTNSWIIREIEHPAALMLTQENINEKILTNVISEIFNNFYKDRLWFKSITNLWDFIPNSRESLKVLEEYTNPLQPDIDLLYCHKVNNKLQTPLTGVEIKLFSKSTGYGKIIPKTSYWSGYYSGLDEAIALLNFGLDYVYLWHLFVFPSKRLFKLSTKYGSNFATKVIGSSIEYMDMSARILGLTIDGLELPIGYVPTYLFIDNKEGVFWFIQPIKNSTSAIFNIVARSEDIKESPHRVRRLLLDGLGIDEIKIRMLNKRCSSCNSTFSPRYVKFKYCPLCGTRLIEE